VAKFVFQTEREVHRFAKLFDALDGDELKALAADIRARGLQERIKLWQEQIIDGQNRYAACKLAGVKPSFTIMKFRNDAEALDFVTSCNLKRRHLTFEQRAFIAAEIAKLKKGQTQIGTRADLKPQTEAANMLGVSVRSVANAKVIAESAPELIPAVKAGEISMTAAAQVARHGPAADDKAALDPDELKTTTETTRVTAAKANDRRIDDLIGVANSDGQTWEQVLDGWWEGTSDARRQRFFDRRVEPWLEARAKRPVADAKTVAEILIAEEEDEGGLGKLPVRRKPDAEADVGQMPATKATKH
jgi:ParB-like chromosome segregation protein Spo0J